MRGIQKDANYTEALLLQPIRRNVRASAADVVLHLGKDATVDVVLGKLDQIFGSILSVESLLERFYVAHQLQTETVATWACRLADLLCQVQGKQKAKSLFSETVPRIRTNTGTRAFNSCAHSLWNKLLLSVRSATFRRHLKTYLLTWPSPCRHRCAQRPVDVTE